MLKKIGYALMTIFISLTIMFFVVQLMPGNPVETYAMNIVQTENIQYEIAYERAKAVMNFDPERPVVERYFEFLGNIFLHGQLGTSLYYKKPVLTLVGNALPWTMLIVSFSLLLSFAIGVLLGLYISWRRSKILNMLLMLYQSIFGAIPDYIIAFLLVFLFSVTLGWFPIKGAYAPDAPPGWTWAFVRSALRYAFLPILTYLLTTVASWTIAMRANSLSVLGEDYITYAQARGLGKRRIIINYVGRNALLPMVTRLSLSFALMFGGSPLVESVFVYPGVGLFLGTAVSTRDYPLMQGMFLMIIVSVVVAGLVAEFLYKRLNPRLREAN